MKLFIDFHGKYVINQTNCLYIKREVINNSEYPVRLIQSVICVINTVKQDLLEAKKNGYPITLGLPESPVSACAILQAVRGILGYVPYVSFSPEFPFKELDLEDIRLEARCLL